MKKQCPFCTDHQLVVTAQRDDAFAFPDAYPVAEGHHLVVPRWHVNTMLECTREEMADIWHLVREICEHLAADGYNIGHNAGDAAGQTVDHAHVHVIPRTTGDVPDPRGIRWVLPDTAPYWKRKEPGQV